MPNALWVSSLPAIAGLLVSLLAAITLVLTKSWHGRFSMDGATGVQKFHTTPTPRVGGIPILLGLFSALATQVSIHGTSEGSLILVAIIIAGIPAFLAGLIEDITKNVTPARRLLATMASGLIFAVPFGYAFQMTETQWISHIIAISPVIYLGAIALLCIGMAGVANAVNIIDGFHGLASGSLVVMYGAFLLISLAAGDTELAAVCLILIGTTLGFMIVNFPMGKLFFGDAGAYFSGFALACIAVLATARNADISPFVCLLVIFYPVYETLFSIHRKRKREGSSPSQPDGVHLHMLVSRSLARPISGWVGKPASKNALTGALMWPLTLVCAVMAVASQGSGIAAIIGCAVFAMLYGRIYLIASLQRKPLLKKAQQALQTRAVKRGEA